MALEEIQFLQRVDLSCFYENGVLDVVDLFVECEGEAFKASQTTFDQFYRNVFGLVDFFWFDVAYNHVFYEVMWQSVNSY